MEAHAFKPGRNTGRRIGCAICGQPVGAVVHAMAFPGMEAAAHKAEEARQQAEAAELPAKPLEPRPSIDEKVGKIERESPLFFGTGNYPDPLQNLDPTAPAGAFLVCSGFAPRRGGRYGDPALTNKNRLFHFFNAGINSKTQNRFPIFLVLTV